MMWDVIVIGAGASGLMAARDLCRAGKKVLILEARNRIGGRIYSFQSPEFSKPVDLGAEMVHGNLPVTLQLLRDYKIPFQQGEGDIWMMRNGKLKQGYDFFANSDELETHLRSLKTDLTVKDFLQTHFSAPAYEILRQSVKSFVEGYDAADYARASAFKLRDEWLGEGGWEEYDIEGGYMRLLNAITNEIKNMGAEIILSAVVTHIHWQTGNVELITGNDETYACKQIIISVPLGVLCDSSSLNFVPEIPEHIQAARALGFGPVTKILLEFNQQFWAGEEVKNHAGKSVKNLGFLLSDAPIPTWWTQFPDNTPILTGWLAGTNAVKYETMPESEVLKIALDSLAYIFGISAQSISDQLKAYKIKQWANDTFAKGGYTYATVDAEKHRKKLSEPINNTIFFAGEALYDGRETGTVEAALWSGIEAAKRISLAPH
jgi:monoamine oxidase